MAIHLAPGSVEFLHWATTGLPETATVDVSLDGGATWHPATVGQDGTLTLLVRHPETVGADPAAVPAPAGSALMSVRVTDDPEIVIRPGGTIVSRPAPVVPVA